MNEWCERRSRIRWWQGGQGVAEDEAVARGRDFAAWRVPDVLLDGTRAAWGGHKAWISRWGEGRVSFIGVPPFLFADGAATNVFPSKHTKPTPTTPTPQDRACDHACHLAPATKEIVPGFVSPHSRLVIHHVLDGKCLHNASP